MTKAITIDMAYPVRRLERPLGLVARTPFARAAQQAWPRLGSYVTYLRISRQRLQVRWWQRTARQAELQPAPLRLFAFTRPGTHRPRHNTMEDPSEHHCHR